MIFNKNKFNLPLTTSIIIFVSLVVILLLVYLKQNNFELFDDINIPNLQTTIPLLNNDTIKNNEFVNFINKFIINKNQQNKYISTLANRQNTINNLASQVINLINPTI